MFFSNPSLVPVIMFATRARYKPKKALALRTDGSYVTNRIEFSSKKLTCVGSVLSNLPLGPGEDNVKQVCTQGIDIYNPFCTSQEHAPSISDNRTPCKRGMSALTATIRLRSYVHHFRANAY